MIQPALLLFLAASDEPDPATQALLTVLADALGPQIPLDVRRFDIPPSDADLARAAQTAHALAAARVVWADPQKTRVSVQVFLVAEDEGHAQQLSFREADPASERGRAIGFVVSAYLMPTAARAPPPADLQVQTRAAPPGLIAESTWSADAFGAAGFTPGATGGGAGAGLALRRLLGSHWGLRGGLRARVNTVAAAQSSMVAAALSAGMFRLLAGGAPGRTAFGFRLEALLLHEALTHWSSDDPQPVRRGRRIPGGAGMLEVAVPLGAGAGLHLGSGLELACGSTDVFVRRVRVTRMPPVRLVAEAGLRVRF